MTNNIVTKLLSQGPIEDIAEYSDEDILREVDKRGLGPAVSAQDIRRLLEATNNRDWAEVSTIVKKLSYYNLGLIVS